MRRLVFYIFLFSVLLSGSLSWANPPKKIELAYSLSTKALTVKIEHLSDDQNKHYIRKIVVYINGTEVTSKQNRKQVNPSKYETEIPLEALPGETISVKAYCSEGGMKEAEITIPQEESDEEKTEESMSTEPDAVEPAQNAYP